MTETWTRFDCRIVRIGAFATGTLAQTIPFPYSPE